MATVVSGYCLPDIFRYLKHYKKILTKTKENYSLNLWSLQAKWSYAKLVMYG